MDQPKTYMVVIFMSARLNVMLSVPDDEKQALCALHSWVLGVVYLCWCASVFTLTSFCSKWSGRFVIAKLMWQVFVQRLNEPSVSAAFNDLYHQRWIMSLSPPLFSLQNKNILSKAFKWLIIFQDFVEFFFLRYLKLHFNIFTEKCMFLSLEVLPKFDSLWLINSE